MTATLEALLSRSDDHAALLAPKLGELIEVLPNGSIVGAGTLVGRIRILGQVFSVHAPANTSGIVSSSVVKLPKALSYKDAILTLSSAAAHSDAAHASAQAASLGQTFKLPIGGRYYAKPAPDQEPFLQIGALVRAGDTVAVIEVMKTFNRVQYNGADATVKALLLIDGSDVNAGDPLFALELVAPNS